ncbi:MAG: methyltransferase domain-containing protein [Bryobacterales bacterium]|nr:methyltransferase domain-containing protein [Bryobacterales bacterium]
MSETDLASRYRKRTSRRWSDRLLQALHPPNPFVMNPAEPTDFPLGRWNLYIGGAGCTVQGYINIDLLAIPGVDVVADAEQLPFPADAFQRVECDAVLEHVCNPERVLSEIRRVLAPGGYVHLVTPFCHPFHECPKDFRRFTIDGLKELAGPLDLIAKGWRTGPTATLLVIFIEYVKLLLPFRAWRALSHVLCGWMLFPLRYLDLLLFRSPDAGRIGNHCYIWLRKPVNHPDSGIPD